MLTISTDGRKAALDIRMVLPRNPTGPTKLDAAADAIHRVWAATRDNEYLDVTTGEPSPVRGALQLVFSDIGTPNVDRWNAYDELHLQLVRRGLPAESIRFMHEAKTDPDKARLFAAARAGHVAVLIGSTAKMGVGTNVQARAIALYHLDCPWRPSDIAQREGRILRQGNQNKQVAIVRFVTEGSFDAYMWQGVERKATFIAQLMRGRLDTREIEEIDSAALSAAEAKAISSGNPLLLEHSVLQNEVTRLRRLERAHQRNEQMLLHIRDDAQDRIRRATSDVAALEAALPRITDTSGERFRMQIRGRSLNTRADAGRALTAWADEVGLRWAARHTNRDYGTIGRIGDFPISIALHTGLTGSEVHIALAGIPRSSFILTRDTFLEGGVGTVTRIENRAGGIPELLAAVRAELERSTAQLEETASRIGLPFKHTLALGQVEHRLAHVERRLSTTDDHPRSRERRPASERSVEDRLTMLSSLGRSRTGTRSAPPGLGI